MMTDSSFGILLELSVTLRTCSLRKIMMPFIAPWKLWPTSVKMSSFGTSLNVEARTVNTRASWLSIPWEISSKSNWPNSWTNWGPLAPISSDASNPTWKWSRTSLKEDRFCPNFNVLAWPLSSNWCNKATLPELCFPNCITCTRATCPLIWQGWTQGSFVKRYSR